MSDGDMKKMEAGQTTELEETLAWLADNTAMTLAALSSTSLLDRESGDNALSQAVLEEMIKRTGFEQVNLKNIMRSSQSITAATSTASVNEMQTYDSSRKIEETISPGSSSTVTGTKPKAMLYKYTDDVDYTKLAGYVTKHLRTGALGSGLKVAVLCDWGISAMQLSYNLLRACVFNTYIGCYTGGVEEFNGNTPLYRKARSDDEGEAQAELTE